MKKFSVLKRPTPSLATAESPEISAGELMFISTENARPSGVTDGYGREVAYTSATSFWADSSSV